MDEQRRLFLGEELTVCTLPGRDGRPIGRLPDGRIVLFDQNSPYFEMLAPGMSVVGKLIIISENYVILQPTSEPEKIAMIHYPAIEGDDIIYDLEELVENVSGNAEVIPRALLHIIQLDQLIIRLLRG